VRAIRAVVCDNPNDCTVASTSTTTTAVVWEPAQCGPDVPRIVQVKSTHKNDSDGETDVRCAHTFEVAHLTGDNRGGPNGPLDVQVRFSLFLFLLFFLFFFFFFF
jgi:hypothetical protein